MEDTVKLNEKELTREDLEKTKERLEKLPEVKVVEVKPGQFKTRLQD
jgi:cell division septal protein FtsQ